MLCRQHSEEASLLGFQVNWTKTKIQCNRDIDSVPQMVHVGSRQVEVTILLVKCDFSYSCAAADKISIDLRRRAVPLRLMSYLWSCGIFFHLLSIYGRPMQ